MLTQTTHKYQRSVSEGWCNQSRQHSYLVPILNGNSIVLIEYSIGDL